MRVVVIAGLIAALPIFPQAPYDLATTHDGSALYFSALSPADLTTKIYRWSRDSGLTLFGDRPDLAQLSPFHAAHLYGTELTYEGTVLYHAEPACATGTGGPSFNNCPVGETRVATPNLPQVTLSGFLLVSPNGRFGIAVPYGRGGLWSDWLTGQQIEVDFEGQTIPGVQAPFSANQHAIANNGSLLITAPGNTGVRVWSPAGEFFLPTADYLQNASISADGSKAALNPFDHTLGDLRSPTFVYDLSLPVPFSSPAKFPQFVSMSDDGWTVAYLSGNPGLAIVQAMVSNSDGSGVQQITNLPLGVDGVLLSGDAHYLYVIAGNPNISQDPSGGTQIQRYELATGVVDIVPPVQ